MTFHGLLPLRSFSTYVEAEQLSSHIQEAENTSHIEVGNTSPDESQNDSKEPLRPKDCSTKTTDETINTHALQPFAFLELPCNVQDLIASFITPPQKLKRVAKNFRDEIVPLAISLQIERLKENSDTVKALKLIDIIDLEQYSSTNLVGASEQIQLSISERLENFFSRICPENPPKMPIYDMVANPVLLSEIINQMYLAKIIEVLFKMIPYIEEAGEFAQNLSGMKNPQEAVETAFQWARDIHDLCANGLYFPFVVNLTDGAYKSPERTYLPQAFLKCLSKIPISPFGTLEMEDPQNDEERILLNMPPS